jgi:hypothetical protein
LEITKFSIAASGYYSGADVQRFSLRKCLLDGGRKNSSKGSEQGLPWKKSMDLGSGLNIQHVDLRQSISITIYKAERTK